MIKKHYYKKGDRKGWLKLRDAFSNKGMVGGSDIATILHANPWRSSIELFYTTIGFTPRSNILNEKMAWGTELEDRIGEMYRYFDLETQDLIQNYEAGLQVNSIRNINAVITNDDYPYLFANIDKLLPDINGIGEIKNMNGFVLDVYDKPNTHLLFANCPIGVPVGYYAQLQQYMMVCKKKRGRFIFLRDGSQMIVHEITTDKYLQEKIQEASIDFGARVEKGLEIMAKYPDEHTRIQLLSVIEPEVTDQECYNAFRSRQIEERTLAKKEATIIGTDEQFRIGLEYMRYSEDIKEAKALQTLEANKIKTELFKMGMETLDFGEEGYIRMQKRLSVKLKPVVI